MPTGIQKGYRVGIDLGPAGMGSRSPGTARHVAEQARALFQLDVPWKWVPLVEAESNPLYEEMTAQNLNPVVVTGRKLWTRATFNVGRAWSENRCDLGFATAFFIPWHGKVVANFFDSSIYEYGWTWVQTDRRWNYYLNRTLSTYALWRARRLFVNSNYCVAELRKRFPSWASKCRVVNPGILPAMEEAQDVQPAKLKNLDKPFCLYVGSFSENKNQRRLIEAWAKWQAVDPDVPVLVLVGNYADDYLQTRIEPELRRAPRREEIILPRFLTDQEVSWCYRHASLYIQPSFAEGFGLPVIEAMSYGLPVASSNTTTLPEVGGDAAVYFDPGSAASIKTVVSDLWRDKETRQSLVKRGENRPQNYTWERNARTVASEIETVLAGKS
jgi:glycosyltransferase involved in cell wall biosynthesis